jgi:hypothetical protein
VRIEDDGDKPTGKLLDVMMADAVERTGVIQVLSSAMYPAQVKLRLRVNNEARWLHMLTLILKEEARAEWGAHFCRQYILNEGRLVYTWNFIVQATKLERAVQDVCRVFDLICSNIDMFDDAEERDVKRPPSRRGPNNKAKGQPGNKPQREIGHGDLNEISLVGTEGRAVPEVSWNQFQASGRRKGAHPIGGG